MAGMIFINGEHISKYGKPDDKFGLKGLVAKIAFVVKNIDS